MALSVCGHYDATHFVNKTKNTVLKHEHFLTVPRLCNVYCAHGTEACVCVRFLPILLCSVLLVRCSKESEEEEVILW